LCASGPSPCTTEEVFAKLANTSRHNVCISILRELITVDSSWHDFIPIILSREDDISLLKLNMSDLLAVDLSSITDPKMR
jgi:hypothetical protein